jgi:hypothetical protein
MSPPRCPVPRPSSKSLDKNFLPGEIPETGRGHGTNGIRGSTPALEHIVRVTESHHAVGLAGAKVSGIQPGRNAGREQALP